MESDVITKDTVYSVPAGGARDKKAPKGWAVLRKFGREAASSNGGNMCWAQTSGYSFEKRDRSTALKNQVVQLSKLRYRNLKENQQHHCLGSVDGR